MKEDIPGYTWQQVRPYLLSERLDYIFLAESMQQFIHNMIIYPGLRSDHSVVALDINYHVIERGPSYWRFES